MLFAKSSLTDTGNGGIWLIKPGMSLMLQEVNVEFYNLNNWQDYTQEITKMLSRGY